MGIDLEIGDCEVIWTDTDIITDRDGAFKKNI